MSAPTSTGTGTDTGLGPSLVLSQQRRWAIVLLLFVASLINYVDRTTLSFGLPLISESLHLTAWDKGVLSSAFFWSYALMQIPVGLLADRLNLRWLYAAAFALWSLGQGLTGLAGSLGVLIAFRVILGIGESIYLPGGTKIVSLLFRASERGLPCGVFDSGTRAGMCLGGLLIPLTLERYGWRATFAVIGFSALLWLIPWLWVTPRQLRAPAVQRTRSGTGLEGLGSGEAPALGTQASAVSDHVPKSTWRAKRDLIGICFGFFCFDYYWYLLVTWLPDYLVNVRHFSISKAGWSSVLPFLVFGICQPLGGWIADRLVRAGWNETVARKGIVTVAFLTGLFLIPAARTENAMVAIILIMAGCLVGLSTANQLMILQSCAPPGKIGLWTGIYNFVGNLAGILAPMVTGYLITKTKSYTPALVLAAVMIAAGQLSYWVLVGDLGRGKQPT